MSNNPAKPTVIAIVGPTASGKTAFSIELARHFNGEIISADSRQVYRGMDIGTGKATRREMRGIPHYLLDVASPRRTFTASHFQRRGKKAIRAIVAKNKLPIVVGGTGLYLDALLYGYALPNVRPDMKLRKKLEKQTAPELLRELKKLDPRRAGNIDPHNKRRLVRALEIIYTTKKSVPSREEALSHASEYNLIKIGISPSREQLKQAIAKRLSKRLRQDMIKEVENLHRSGLSWKRLDGFGLEYRFISRYLQKLITKNEMVVAIKKESWLYAKRQMTWFKRDDSIHWIKNRGERQSVIRLIKKAMPAKRRSQGTVRGSA